MLSAKQRALIGHGATDDYLALAVGTIRSGKTHAATAGFASHTLALRKPYKHLLLGRKLRVVESELLPHMEMVASAAKVPYSYSRSDHVVRAGNQEYHLVAGNDASSKDRVTGLTCHSALIDEATLVPESFWDMALSRLSFPDSKAWATCNPAHPTHWLKKKWLDAGKVDVDFDFDFTDNPALSDDVIARYKLLYAGVFAKRMIQGLWIAAEGVIFPDVTVEDLDPDSYTILRAVIGVDYGITAPTAYVPILAVRLKESGLIRYYVPRVRTIEGSRAKSPSDRKLVKRLQAESERYQRPLILVDPSAASLIDAMREWPDYRFRTRRAQNAVLPGIRNLGGALERGDLIISPEAKALLEELSGYAWDDKAPDKPIKRDDHHVDALRYAGMEILKLRIRGPVPLPFGY